MSQSESFTEDVGKEENLLLKPFYLLPFLT